MSAIDVGSIWIERDRRMNGRRVIVKAIEGERVRYAPAPPYDGHITYTSKSTRFVRAFKLSTARAALGGK